MQSDLRLAFRSLFLDGNADGLEPVQALGLFNDFKNDLTPIGADGDLMVRKLVRRLVDVDLLDQAAEPPEVPGRQPASVLACPRPRSPRTRRSSYLMNRKPGAERSRRSTGSRTTVLPNALNAERRLVESRAWMGVGRFDSALEIIEKDTTKEGQDLRAEIVWKQKDWAKAGPQFEKALGERWKTPGPLSADEEGKLLRAGVAYSLAGEDAALTRLSGQYKGFFDAAHNPEAAAPHRAHRRVHQPSQRRRLRPGQRRQHRLRRLGRQDEGALQGTARRTCRNRQDPGVRPGHAAGTRLRLARPPNAAPPPRRQGRQGLDLTLIF